MNRWLIYAIVTLLFLAALVGGFDKAQVNALRAALGFAPLYLSEGPDLGAEERALLLAEVAERPMPGLVDEVPPTLGEAAELGVACLGAMSARAPGPAAGEALRRYLLALAAAGLEEPHPLVEPRLAPLHALVGQGPLAAMELARNDATGLEEAALLAEFHRTYADADHPLYDGLRLHGGTFEAMDFEAATALLAERWREVGDCVSDRLLLVEPEGEAPATE